MAAPAADDWLSALQRVDAAVYATIAQTPTAPLDEGMRRLSRAANYSRLSMASAALLALSGGPGGRRAAAAGLGTVALTSGFVNLLVKPAARRRRPERDRHAPPDGRIVRMPASASFPSGHTAAAFAFASAVGRSLPVAAIPLRLLATAVGYSRVHTGVHYPGDVVAGGVIGELIAELSAGAVDAAAARLPAAQPS